VSLTADATPCLAAGSDDTIALVAGVMARPTPAARTSWAISNGRKPLSASSVPKASRPTALMASPDPPMRRCPYRSASGAAAVDVGIMTNVIGRSATAAPSAL
jgi:hypothetical protein